MKKKFLKGIAGTCLALGVFFVASGTTLAAAPNCYAVYMSGNHDYSRHLRTENVGNVIITGVDSATGKLVGYQTKKSVDACSQCGKETSNTWTERNLY